MPVNPNEGLSVLVIESQEGQREQCIRILEDEGFDVRAAGDGSWGLGLVEEQLPDIVFLDLRLPKMPGIMVLERIVEMAPHTVLVAMTDRATVTLALDALRQGAHEFLTKPFTPEEFREMADRARDRCERIRCRPETPGVELNYMAERAARLTSILRSLEADLRTHPELLAKTRGAIQQLEELKAILREL